MAVMVLACAAIATVTDSLSTYRDESDCARILQLTMSLYGHVTVLVYVIVVTVIVEEVIVVVTMICLRAGWLLALRPSAFIVPFLAPGSSSDVQLLTSAATAIPLQMLARHESTVGTATM